MIEVENKVSSELIAHLKTVIYRHCIDDFIVVNWAYEVKGSGNFVNDYEP